MDGLLEKFTEDLDSDTAITLFNLKSAIASDIESPHAEPHEERSAQHYTDTGLADDAATILNKWIDNGQIHTVSDEIVTEHIDEILLLLITVRGGACGKELLQDIRRLFGADLSPGTVYPHLVELAEDDILEMQKLSKRKLYQLSDPGATFTRVDHAADQLLLFSLVLKAILNDCEPNQSQGQSSQSETNE